MAREKRDLPHFTVAVPFSSTDKDTFPSGSFLTISLNSLASIVVFPCSTISPSIEDEIPSSRSLPTRTISFPIAVIKILFKTCIVVFPGTAFNTLFTAFANIFFSTLMFIIIFSFLRCCSYSRFLLYCV